MANERSYLTNFEDNKVNDVYQSAYQDAQNLWGVECFYIPLDKYDNNLDGVFGEIKSADYTSMYGMRMILEDALMLQGPGDVFSKFGLDVQDEILLHSTRKEFIERVTGEEHDPHDGSNIGIYEKEKDLVNDEEFRQPQIKDLIYVPMWERLFEISFVEYYDFRLGGEPAWYKFTCKLLKVDITADNFDIIAGDTSDVDAEVETDIANTISAIEDDEISKVSESTDPDTTQTGYEPNRTDGIINDDVEEDKDDIKPPDEVSDFLSDW